LDYLEQDKIAVSADLSAKNHLYRENLAIPIETSKGFMSNLRALRESGKAIEQSSNLRHQKRCFSFSIKHWKLLSK